MAELPGALYIPVVRSVVAAMAVAGHLFLTVGAMAFAGLLDFSSLDGAVVIAAEMMHPAPPKPASALPLPSVSILTNWRFR
ncbi:MAG: hypothetical protein OSB69_18230 [Alphaproteobacteria bacterium]|nr:hypothetical protein [Alphaproteobacteria bacterium]